MIKLIASDIDGTLLEEGTDKINPVIYEVIRQLKKKGILFAAASGRQYASMRHVFEPVADDMIFIAENGSNVMCRGRNMSCDYMEQEVAEELLLYLRALEGCDIIVSTPETMYLETRTPELCRKLEEDYHNEVSYTEDLLPLCRKTNKMAIYCPGMVEKYSGQLQERFGDRLNVMISGSVWIDFMNKTADKGRAMESIQKTMKISREETMAFGDNCNDVGMLLQAEESYAVENAHPDLIRVARHTAPAYYEDGVIKTIREVCLSD